MDKPSPTPSLIFTALNKIARWPHAYRDTSELATSLAVSLVRSDALFLLRDAASVEAMMAALNAPSHLLCESRTIEPHPITQPLCRVSELAPIVILASWMDGSTLTEGQHQRRLKGIVEPWIRLLLRAVVHAPQDLPLRLLGAVVHQLRAFERANPSEPTTLAQTRAALNTAYSEAYTPHPAILAVSRHLALGRLLDAVLPVAQLSGGDARGRRLRRMGNDWRDPRDRYLWLMNLQPHEIPMLNERVSPQPEETAESGRPHCGAYVDDDAMHCPCERRDD